MEAEYMAAFGAIQELIWLKGVLSPMHHKRSKHIDIKYYWLREHTYEDGTIHLEHCVTEDMVADLMTKALLAFDLHNKHGKNITGNGDVV